jgi:N6-adenosine-specific RNA methylase IME4
MQMKRIKNFGEKMEQLKIDKEFKDLIPPLQEDEFKQLESNLINEGWRNNERIITWNETIVDGHNRYDICSKNNIKFQSQEKKFKDKNEVILWIIDNQLGRRNLMPYDRVRLNLKKEVILKPIAEKNQKSGTFVSDDTKVDVLSKIATSSDVGRNTVAKVKFIEAKADKETKEKLSSGTETINKVYMDLKRGEQREEAIIKAKDINPLETKKKYSIIYADPPWKYFFGGHHNASFHYNCMEIEEIKNLPVKDLSKEDCILFLWITFPMLKEAFEVIEAWGFEYSTCGFNWIKKNKSGEGWFFGLGNWTRSNSELCLIATKGKPIRQSPNVFQIIDTPREEHSKKPDIVRNKIVELMGDLPRIELFAREKVNGWDNWGNEVSNSDKKESKN